MFSDAAVAVEKLSNHLYKKHFHRLHKTLPEQGEKYFSDAPTPGNVDFQIQNSETVDTIDCNDSGKLTPLQMICCTANPYSRKVTTHGDVAESLGLSARLSPELTGREDIYFTDTTLDLGKNSNRQKYAGHRSICQNCGIHRTAGKNPFQRHTDQAFLESRNLAGSGPGLHDWSVTAGIRRENRVDQHQRETHAAPAAHLKGRMRHRESLYLRLQSLEPSYLQGTEGSPSIADRIVNAVALNISCHKEICTPVYFDTTFNAARVP